MDLLWVIWAFGETDNIVKYHFHNRGRFRVYLLDPNFETQKKELERWELRNKVILTGKKTTYVCTIHRAPILTEKHSIVEVNLDFMLNQLFDKINLIKFDCVFCSLCQVSCLLRKRNSSTTYSSYCTLSLRYSSRIYRLHFRTLDFTSWRRVLLWTGSCYANNAV